MRPISLVLGFNLFDVERAKLILKLMFFLSSTYANEGSKINCISRMDDKDKNLFVGEQVRKRRWNLYSQITIENDTGCTRFNGDF